MLLFLIAVLSSVEASLLVAGIVEMQGTLTGSYMAANKEHYG